MDATTKTNYEAFVLGFMHGRKAKKYISRRKIEARFPYFSMDQATVYHNGHDDGVNGDDYRFSLIRAEYAKEQRAA